MKKTITLTGMMFLALTAVALTAVAGTPESPVLRPVTNHSFSEMLKDMQRGNNKATALKATSVSGVRKAPGKAAPWSQDDLPTEGITEQPQGTLYKNMYRTAGAIYDWGGGMYEYQKIDGMAFDFVINDETGEAFIKNPLSSMLTDTWIKGQKAVGDTLEFKFPQYATRIELGGFGDDYYVCRLKLDTVETDWGTKYTAFVPDMDSQTIQYVWRNDSLIKVGDAIMGMATSDGTFAGYGDIVQTNHPVKEARYVPEHPENAGGYAMFFPLQDEQTDVRVVKGTTEGSAVYLQGLDEMLPDAWVKGTLSDGKVSFPAMQYFGVDSSLALPLHKFFAPVATVSVPDAETGGTRDSMVIAPSLDFDYDASTGIFSSEKGFVVNFGTKAIDYLVHYLSESFEPWTEKAATPSNPVITGFNTYEDDEDWGDLTFDVDKESVDGDVLDDTKMWLNFYADGKLYVFTPENYEDIIYEDVTDVPLLYSDGAYFITNGAHHTVSFKRSDFKKIGVQVIYYGNNEKRTSDIVYYESQGIDALSQNGAAVSAVTYTSLDGRRIAAPSRGLCIKHVTYTDGTSRTSKVLVR